MGTFFLLNSRRGTGISWVEARDAVKHPVIHKIAPTTKTHLALNVSSAAVANPALEMLTCILTRA